MSRTNHPDETPLHQARRNFLKRAVLAGTATTLAGPATILRAQTTEQSPNEKLNIGCIGVGGRGAANLAGVASENIVALCDIDSQRLGVASTKYPQAEKYRDFRKMLERTDLDAVVVSTPDHSHAMPVLIALELGLGVYCEKPLAHSIYEVRKIRDRARRQNAITQMGNNIHSGYNYRRVVEIVQAGILGKVSRVHIWRGNTVQPGKRVSQATPPSHVDYDLWTGPAPLRPYHESHFHFHWRNWWDFGGGTLGDFGCHYIDLPMWALRLGAPTSVKSVGSKTYQGDNQIPDNLQVDYQFAARGDQPAVHLTWYHGAMRPAWSKEYKNDYAILFEGERGRMIADYGTLQVFLDDGSPLQAPLGWIPNSLGQHQEWIDACKNRGGTMCNFDYSGQLTETALLGNVAYQAGQSRLDWDADAGVARNCPQASAFLKREYRKGWEL